jgi:hypothetical protein
MKMIAALLALLCASAALAGEPITLDSRHQLFLDDYLIASMKNVKRTVEQAQKHPKNPLVWPGESWEDKMSTIYGSVIRDGDRFKVWYKSGMGVGYAESEDGIRWVKPALDLVIIDGQKTNLLWRKKGKTEPPDGFPYYYELFGVHRDDREADASRRYKMGFLDIDFKHTGPGGDPFHKGQRRGMGVAGSPDGIHWKLINNWATEAICDGATHWMWDPARSKYVLYGRTRKALPEVVEAWSKYDWYKNWFSARAVARVESADFVNWEFTSPESAPVVMTADLQDVPGTEIYSMKVFPYEGIYIGLLQVFHAVPDQSTLDVQLTMSRDGVNFTRVGDRGVFIPLGPAGSWDRFNHSLANNDPIQVGDDLRIYYGGRMYRHGPYSGPDKGVERGGMGLATIKRDRFVALEGSFEKGSIVTKPLKISGSALHLNAKADFGEIIVELLDEQGKSLAKSKPITQDLTDLNVQWKNDLKLPDISSLRISISNARLYAIWTN